MVNNGEKRGGRWQESGDRKGKGRESGGSKARTKSRHIHHRGGRRGTQRKANRENLLNGKGKTQRNNLQIGPQRAADKVPEFLREKNKTRIFCVKAKPNKGFTQTNLPFPPPFPSS